MDIRWKACIVAHSCDALQIDRSVLQLRQAGWEEFFVFAPNGVKAPDRPHTNVSRCKNLHNINEHIDYALTYEALSSLVTGYLREATFFLFAKPGLYVWEQLQHYCEAQIEPARLSVWGMHTPATILSSERRKRPEWTNGDGFYRVKSEDPLLALDVFVIAPAVAKFLLSVLPEPQVSEFKTFAQAIGDLTYKMPALELWMHHRSLVMLDEVDCPDFVGVGYDMPNSELNELKPLNQ